jgi:hypothetical protein
MYDFLSVAPTLEAAAELSEAGMTAEAAELRAGIIRVLNDALDAAKKRIRERILAAGYGLLFQDAINSLFTLAPSLRA